MQVFDLGGLHLVSSEIKHLNTVEQVISDFL